MNRALLRRSQTDKRKTRTGHFEVYFPKYFVEQQEDIPSNSVERSEEISAQSLQKSLIEKSPEEERLEATEDINTTLGEDDLASNVGVVNHVGNTDVSQEGTPSLASMIDSQPNSKSYTDSAME